MFKNSFHHSTHRPLAIELLNTLKNNCDIDVCLLSVLYQYIELSRFLNVKTYSTVSCIIKLKQNLNYIIMHCSKLCALKNTGI